MADVIRSGDMGSLGAVGVPSLSWSPPWLNPIFRVVAVYRAERTTRVEEIDCRDVTSASPGDTGCGLELRAGDYRFTIQRADPSLPQTTHPIYTNGMPGDRPVVRLVGRRGLVSPVTLSPTGTWMVKDVPRAQIEVAPIVPVAPPPPPPPPVPDVPVLRAGGGWVAALAFLAIGRWMMREGDVAEAQE